mgnify:FL=1
MMQQLANFIVDHDPMMVLQRTHDTVRYIRWAWNKDHADLIDEDGLRLFLCDEHRGDLTEEQKVFARRCRDEMRSVYEEMCVRLLQHEIMLERGMVPDVSTYRSVFCTEGGDAPWMLDQAGWLPFSQSAAERLKCASAPKILASRMTSFAFVVRNGAIAPFRPLRQAG